jgi:hypothetical protein
MLRDPRAKGRVLVTRVDGPLDIMDIQNRFGGGRYEYWGFHGGKLQKRKTIELEGPRKSYDLPSAPSAIMVSPAPAAPVTDERVMGILNELSRKVEVLSNADSGAGGISVKEMVALMDFMRSQNPPTPSGGSMKELVEVFKMGADLAGEVGGGKRGTLEVVLEKLGPVIERVGTAMVTARPRPLMRPSAAPPTPGQAVEAPARVVAEPEPMELDMDQVRMTSAVDSLSRAITGGQDPADFAGALEDILSPEQVHLLKALPEATVIDTILGTAAGHYPVLVTDSARAYMAAVLTELKAEPEA